MIDEKSTLSEAGRNHLVWSPYMGTWTEENQSYKTILSVVLMVFVCPMKVFSRSPRLQQIKTRLNLSL